MTLRELIIDYRERHGLSQRQFANRCGLSNAYISNIENGSNPHTGRPISPSVVSIKKLAEGMGLTVSELTAYVDDGKIEPSEWDLTEKERQMVTEFRGMDEAEQNVLIATARAITGNKERPTGRGSATGGPVGKGR